MKLQFVLGTAAELIKLFPLIVLAKQRGHDVHMSATGQSRENLLMQIRDFNLPQEQLDWLWSSAGDLDNSMAALKWFTKAWWTKASTHFEPDYVFVHGDTLSTWVGARYGRKIRRPIVHIEAGLRSSSLLNPFPEEITRRQVSGLASVHFTPDHVAESNLRQAGVGGTVMCSQGNTLMDAVRMAGTASENAPPHKYVLVNIHRFENLNSSKRWSQIVETLLQAAQTQPLIMVSHPQTRAKLESEPATIQKLRAANVDLRDRMPFSSFIGLLKGAEYLISDGGSNQEECSYLGKPCLLLREATERREGLDTCCLLTRFDKDLIQKFLSNPSAYKTSPISEAQSPSKLILDYLEARPV